MRRVSRDPSRGCFLFLRAGARGGRVGAGLVAGAGRRGGGDGHLEAPSGPCWAQTVGAPSRGRQVLRELGLSGLPGSSPSPLPRPGVSLAARAGGAPRQRPGRATWPCEGRRFLRPTCHPLPFPSLFGARTSERAKYSGCLFSSILRLLSPSVVVPAPVSSSAPAAAAAAPLAPALGKDVERVTALPPESSFFSGEGKVVDEDRTWWGLSGELKFLDFAPGRDVERNTGSLRPR